MKLLNNPKLIIAFVCAVIIASVLWDTFIAEGQDKTALHLAQCLRAECGDCDTYWNEKAAIAHVLQKRAEILEWPLDRMIRAYCAVFKSSSARALAIRHSTFEHPREGSPQWWIETSEWTDRFLAGNVEDPLPSAIHWGGPADHYRAIKQKLHTVARYTNRFYSF